MLLKQNISLNSDHQNFTDCDRCALKLLLLHLNQANENTHKFSQNKPILKPFTQALDSMGMIVVASDGQVEVITQQAEQLLSQYSLPHAPHTLPELLQHWFKHQIGRRMPNGNNPSARLPLQVEQAGRLLIVRLISQSIREQYILLLEEQELPTFSIATLELLGLTKREAEVLFWIAKDKSNAGIARLLGCCEGTVRKHLEKLYKKLGVQSRMGAVMIALEKLGLLKG